MSESSKIIVPKKRRLDETEEVILPCVKCSVCGNPTTQGLHQIRLIMIKPARLWKNKITGAIKRVPPVMKREDVYMCIRCVEQQKKWPGTKPT